MEKIKSVELLLYVSGQGNGQDSDMPDARAERIHQL
jgi:hypothetical protein